MVKKNEKKGGFILTTGIVTIALTLLGLVLFLLSYTTNYYTFGQMNSVLITILIGCAVVCAAANIALVKKLPGKTWPKYVTYAVTALLAAAAMYIVGDRVEGIGNCILTDYDSGHGGEEAIYMSLIGAVILVAAMIYNIIGAFSKDSNAPAGKGRVLGHTLSASVLGVAAIVATLFLTGVFTPAATNKAGTAADVPGGAVSTTYTVSYNMNNGNLDGVQDYQFLPANLKGIMGADARLYMDLSLTLDGRNGYVLVADSYVIEGGDRAVVGDDTGLGMVLKTTAEGLYTDNGDGSVTIAKPVHASFEMQMDTYSSQMKAPIGVSVDGSDADGTYDSFDVPALLDAVPETVFQLVDGKILSYAKAALKGTFSVNFNANAGTADTMPNYQFLCSALDGMLRADSRFNIDVTLTLDGAGTYTLFVDSYVIEGGARAVVGDDTGLGLVLTTKAEGTYVDNGDGTVTTSPAVHAVFEMQTDTYSSQMKGAAQMNVGGNDADGVYDSNDAPAVLDFIPETIWTLSNGKIVTYASTAVEEEAPAEEEAVPEEPEQTEVKSEGAVIASSDGATTVTFNADGSFVFDFAAYGIQEIGSWTYADGKLTVTNPNGLEAVAEGDPLNLHYVSAASEQLTGVYEIPASALTFSAAEEAVPAAEPVVVASSDGATTVTFNADGTFIFNFAAYSIEEIGSWTYADGKLIVLNPNGLEAVAEGDPLNLHYVTAVSDQLTGDYTIPASALAFGSAPAAEAVPAAEPVVAVSDDGGTEITFNPDGTYRFFFSSYNVEDLGTYTYENGVLTLVNANGVEATADGDPLKLHYVTAVSDQLTGDYTISASTFTFEGASAAVGKEAAEPEAEEAPDAIIPEVTGSIFDGPVNVPSTDGRTYIVFDANGTYEFRFDEYNIVDAGTYVFDGNTLTLVDPTGKEYAVEGDPLNLTYAYSAYDALTGEFVIPASVFSENIVQSVFDGPVTFTSENGTTMILDADGNYQFRFDEYNIVEDGILRLTDPNGKEYVPEGDPFKLTYAYSAYEQLTGDFTIPAATFMPSSAQRLTGEFTVTGENRPALLSFHTDGTYFFNYEQYGLEEEGRYTYSGGVLKLTNGKNVVSSTDGDPMALDYETAISSMLVIHYTIPAESFNQQGSASGGAALFQSENGNGTTMTFNDDGTYQFRFDEYNIVDDGTYTYEDNVLTLMDANGKTYTAEGDSLSFTYAYSAYDMLTGDFVVPADTFRK